MNNPKRSEAEPRDGNDLENLTAQANIQNYLMPAPDFDANGEDPQSENYESYRITDITPIPQPQPVVKISGQTVAVREELTAIVGAPKSGKTALENMLISGSLSQTGKVLDGIDSIEVATNVNRLAVVHMDTEQPRFTHQRNLKNIIKRAGFESCPDFYRSYNVRKMDFENYQNTLTEICQQAAQLHGGIFSVFVDGGADFIADVNDPSTSNAMIKYFEGLAAEFNTAVFLVVHTNPGNSEKERGHFGSQLQRKTGGTIFVKNEGDISVIELKRLRYGGSNPTEMLTFKYDSEKKYHIGWHNKTAGASEADKARLKVGEAENFAEMILSGQKSYSGGKLIKQIMMKKGCQERTAKQIFALMNAGEMITKGADNNYRVNAQYKSEL